MWRTSLLLAVAMVIPAGLGLAQEPSKQWEIRDPVGDVRLIVGASETPAPPGSFQGIDIVGLSITESEFEINYGLRLGALDSQGALYEVRFSWLDQTYRVGFTWNKNGQTASATLQHLRDGDDPDDWLGWSAITDVELQVDTGSATLVATVPKAYLRWEPKQYPPAKGDSLVSIVAISSSTGTSDPGTVGDIMPDSGTASYTMLSGPTSRGNIRLTSFDPTRISNGGAQTYTFAVRVANTGSAPERVMLTQTETPAGWSTSIPDSVQIGPHSEVSIPVIVSIPFAHEHGGFTALKLTATSGTDPASYATMRLGVLHTKIPQPAGHHPELRMHAQRSSEGSASDLALPRYELTMNTLAGHESDVPSVPASRGTSRGLIWAIALDPTWQLGLDFDVNSTGVLEGALRGDLPGEVALSADVVLVSAVGSPFDRAYTLAVSAPASASRLLNEATPFSLVLTPTPEADRVVFDPLMNLYVRVYATPLLSETRRESAALDPNRAHLVTEAFRLELPLVEFQETTPSIYGLEIVSTTPTMKVVAPGTVVAYPFEVVNRLREAVSVNLRVEGPDSGLASIEASRSLRLGVGQQIAGTLFLSVPDDAVEGQAFLATLLARSDGVGAAAFATLPTVTTASAPSPSSSLEQAPGHSPEGRSPSWTPLVAAGVLVVAVSAGIVVRTRSRR